MNATARFWLGVGTVLALLLALITWALLYFNLNNYSQRVSDRLLLLAELRRGAIQQYLNTARTELQFWSINPELLGAQEQLVALWQSDVDASMASRRYIDNHIDNQIGNSSEAPGDNHSDPHSDPRSDNGRNNARNNARNNGRDHAVEIPLDNTIGNTTNTAIDNQPDDSAHRGDAGEGSSYGELHGTLHEQAALFVTERGYYDFFLINPDGDVMYTVEKEADFATNLLTGPWQHTGLAEVFRRASNAAEHDAIALSDMRAYTPSNDAPAIFMATPMHSASGEPLGVIAFQLPTDRILSIMNYTAGMGETGETYLVGPDQLMRSNSRFSDISTVLRQTVDGPTVNTALTGAQQIDIVEDYRGVSVLSVALPMPVGNVNWAVMAEIDQAEVEREAANAWPNIAAPMGFVYALSLWSVWYWRNRSLPDDDQVEHVSALDSGMNGGMDGGGLDA